MKKSTIHKYLAWLLVFAFVCVSVFTGAGKAEAAGKKTIRSVTVKMAGKTVTKKTVTLQKGKNAALKVSASPHIARKNITFKSDKKTVAAVDKNGKITAKKAGTARITIILTKKGYKKKTTWVKIKVSDSQNSTEDVQPPAAGNGKSLVVYFSRTRTTKAVAEEIQSLTGSDLVELKTVVPYPSSYSDCLAQAQEEKANNARPELSTRISNMSEYDTVYVGYPIWCYTAPMAVFTFLESYDFTGKTVIPFCTSGSSSISQSVTDIRSICSGVNVLDGFRAGGSETVEAWLARIGQTGNQSAVTKGNALIAYFSLSENTSSSKEEQSSGLDALTSASVVTDGEDAYGNTEYIARLIQEKTGGTLYQIQTKENYSTDFDEVIDQNHAEMNASSLPELKDRDLDISQYDIVFIGYPVWSSTIPRAIHAFLHQYDLSGKTVIPFCTHNGYGSGDSYSTIAGLCPNATNLNGLAVAATEVKEAGDSVERWLDGLNLSFQEEKNITVKVHAR